MSYSRGDVRDLLRNNNINPYDVSGETRWLIRNYLNDSTASDADNMKYIQDLILKNKYASDAEITKLVPKNKFSDMNGAPSTTNLIRPQYDVFLGRFDFTTDLMKNLSRIGYKDEILTSILSAFDKYNNQ